MVEETRTECPRAERTLQLLTEDYRSILARYEEILRLSRQERELLRGRGSIEKLNELLRCKRAILGGIREEEDRVRAAKDWWRRRRRSLPEEGGRELLSLLDATTRTLERLLALEAECRQLLERRLCWRTETMLRTEAAGAAAAGAYRGPAEHLSHKGGGGE